MEEIGIYSVMHPVKHKKYYIEIRTAEDKTYIKTSNIKLINNKDLK